jgi:thiol-disulfide isomerase/thioredoxin
MSSRSSITCFPFALALVLALAIAGCDKAKAPPGQPVANTAATAAATPNMPAAEPEALDRSHKGQALPAMPFAAAGGAPATFGAFRGHPLLVNLWATWCAPCVKELPSLDALAAREKGKLAVVAISEDDGGDAQVGPFFKAHDITALVGYTDPRMKMTAPLGVAGLPTTILFDGHGKEVWRTTGGRDWTSAETAALLAEAK